MKLCIILFLTCCISVSQLFGQTTPIPDPVFEQALIDANIDNNGLNGNILNSDAAAITVMNVDTMGISSLLGIEAFLNLADLSAKGNLISTIDLTSNTNLVALNLSFNQLSSINLSSNVSLTHVNIEGNALSSIDVSDLSMLDDLDLGGNLLTSLDVTSNPLLTSLEIWNIFSHTNSNQISTIDLSNNPLLFRFLCIDNQLTSLDITNNPELFTVNCSDNLISELDVSNNLNLFTLSCSNNLLTELDVAHLDLGGLNCYGNQISGTIDLGSSSDLVLLNCSDNQIDSIILPPTPYILDLYVYDNNLTSLDVSHLGIIEEFICQNNQLQTLNMSNGTNTFLQSFNALNNPQLSCISVDDVDYANATFVNAVDPGVIFSEDCNLVSVQNIVTPDALSFFPNPTSNLIFSSNESPINEILIYNEMGQVVQRNTKFPVSLSTLLPGVYLIQVIQEDGSRSAKLIRSR